MFAGPLISSPRSLALHPVLAFPKKLGHTGIPCYLVSQGAEVLRPDEVYGSLDGSSNPLQNLRSRQLDQAFSDRDINCSGCIRIPVLLHLTSRHRVSFLYSHPMELGFFVSAFVPLRSREGQATQLGASGCWKCRLRLRTVRYGIGARVYSENPKILGYIQAVLLHRPSKPA